MKSTALSSRQIAEATAALIPVPEVSFFLWNCMMGEQFPPLFSDSGGGSIGVHEYIAQGAFPAIHVRNGSGGPVQSAAALWGPLPLYRPGVAVFSGLQVQARLFVATGALSVGGSLVFDVAGMSITMSGSGSYSITCGPTSLGGIPLILDRWVPVAFTLTAAGVFTAALDGAQVLTGPGALPTDAPLPRWAASGAAGEVGDGYLTALSYTYL